MKSATAREAVLAEATKLFGDEEAALKWMNTPADFVSGQAPITPMNLAATESGARLLLEQIRRTEFGMF